MRISPKSLSPAEAISKAKAKAQARDDERRDAQDEAPELDIQMATSSPAAIDAGRAQRLLERAVSLAGRGDMGAAILATRQSLALAPDSVEAHLLHARLLERNRDFGGARVAYEKSVQLAPNRQDARDNLARLDAYLEKSQGAARQFHFDADELFAPGSNGAASESGNSPENSGAAEQIVAAPQAATPADSAAAVSAVLISAAPAAPQMAEQVSEIDARAMLDESMLPVVEARLPPTRSQVAQHEAGDKIGTQAPAQSASMAQSEAPNAPAPQRVGEPGAPHAPADERRKHNIPVATERRRRSVAAVPLAAPFAVPIVGAASQAAAVPLRPAPANAAANPFDIASINRPATRAPLALDIPAAPAAPLWQQVMTRPSFYARTLPLVGVALLSLGFLSWARGRAVSQIVAPTELVSANATTTTDAPATLPATVPGTTLPLPPDAAQSGTPTGNVAGTNGAGFPIANAPAVFQAPPAKNSGATNVGAANVGATNTATGNGAAGNVARPSGNSAPSTTARANNRGPNSNNSSARPRRVLPPARPVPNFPGVLLAPAPIPPASVRSTNPGAPRGDSGNNIILPSPNIDLPEAAAPRQRVLPPSDNGLNPAGSPGRGYVRVTEGRVGNGVIPSQPSAVARDNERAANDATRNGQNDTAISQLSQAIRADSENAGFRYQQRATLFLQRGDYNRASDDFQSAISAYQNQITNGNDASAARRGLSSARSGLSLALAGKRG